MHFCPAFRHTQKGNGTKEAKKTEMRLTVREGEADCMALLEFGSLNHLLFSSTLLRQEDGECQSLILVRKNALVKCSQTVWYSRGRRRNCQWKKCSALSCTFWKRKVSALQKGQENFFKERDDSSTKKSFPSFENQISFRPHPVIWPASREYEDYRKDPEKSVDANWIGLFTDPGSTCLRTAPNAQWSG